MLESQLWPLLRTHPVQHWMGAGGRQGSVCLSSFFRGGGTLFDPLDVIMNCDVHDEAPVPVARRRPPIGIFQGPDRQANYMTPHRLFSLSSIPHRGSLAQLTEIGKCTHCHRTVCHLREVGRLNHTQSGGKKHSSPSPLRDPLQKMADPADPATDPL